MGKKRGKKMLHQNEADWWSTYQLVTDAFYGWIGKSRREGVPNTKKL